MNVRVSTFSYMMPIILNAYDKSREGDAVFLATRLIDSLLSVNHMLGLLVLASRQAYMNILEHNPHLSRLV